MVTTADEGSGRPPTGRPLVEVESVSKHFGPVTALDDVSMAVHAGEVMGLLGDNGAGKSTLIKILCGVHRPDEGTVIFDGREVAFRDPREAQAEGIATVHQDLAMIPLMTIARNFFLGREPTRGWGPFKMFDATHARKVAAEQLREVGIHVRSAEQLVGTLSGGERQSVAIARACYFGARLLILDEPTSALGVKEAAIVLRYVDRARASGLGVIVITHNLHHVYPVADRFTILDRGRSRGIFEKGEISREEVLSLMAGGQELEELAHEFRDGGEGAAGEARG